jgi:phosphohistidine phosphatase
MRGSYTAEGARLSPPYWPKMRCYFLRHGIAAEPESWSGSDFDRPLTREGRERMEREARAIEELGLELDCIVTSPLLRAKQTAELVAQRLGNATLVEDRRLADGFNLERLGAILSSHPDAESIMLVGHEPSMSTTIGRSIGDANIELKKAALAAIEFDERGSPAGTLLYLIPPKVLVALGKR